MCVESEIKKESNNIESQCVGVDLCTISSNTAEKNPASVQYCLVIIVFFSQVISPKNIAF